MTDREYIPLSEGLNVGELFRLGKRWVDDFGTERKLDIVEIAGVIYITPSPKEIK